MPPSAPMPPVKPSSRLHRVVIVCGLLAWTTACGRSGDALPPASDFPAHGEPARTLVRAIGDNPTELRYRPTAGQSDTLAIFADITVSAGGGAASMEMGFGMDLEATCSVESVETSGVFRQTMEIGEARVSLRGELTNLGGNGTEFARAMKGLKMGFDIDGQGRIVKADIVEGESAMAGQLGQMQAGLDQALQGGVIPFPTEAIGVGGAWDSLAIIDSMGAKIRAKTSFKLASLEGTRGRLALEMTGVADPQTLKMPNVPGEVEVSYLEMKSRGTIDFDLTRPSASKIDLSLDLSMSLSARGERATMTMKATIRSAPRG